jgi:ABC-type Fe3+ transport system substrate-binding protein|uniref:ABC transporter n=2 Tax=Globisporangium ultimum (strain ATCC 200006 / CBS 805.95 / DAOM BR144) TaxID=431595 RepID=K3WIS8_GLOUD
MRVLSALIFLSSFLASQSAIAAKTTKAAVAVKEETKTIDQLYQAAIKEGGNLIVYHGGDTPTQQDGFKAAFKKAFPKLNLTVVVDYSKYHNVRIDNQLETNTLVPDVVALQTLQDFPRWAEEGHLLNYKPANFSQIYDGFKDPNGAWYAYIIFSFMYASNEQALGSLAAPATPLQLVDPKYKGKIASSYPHDDDAVLFLFTRYVEKYGWDWAAKFAKQDVSFNRGSNVAGELINAGKKAIAVGAGGNPAGAINGKYPFIAWGQRVAILKKAKNVAAAKLLVNWWNSEAMQRQNGFSGWTVRKDLPTTNGFKQVWEIPEANSAKFATFMENREVVEFWKQKFALYFGEVQGEPTPGVLGLHPK